MAGILYVVSTPIGNLDDISLRAIRTLREVDYIIAEDTRTTSKLRARYHIATPFYRSCYQGAERARVDETIALLRTGKNIALVSDAGTPLVSDPGYPLVRAAVEHGIKVVPIPGPSAALAALVASGLPSDRFCFEGILPRAEAARRARITALRVEPRTIIIYESPHRLSSTLAIMRAIMPNRMLVLARELTKVHEEFIRGTPAEIEHALESRPVKGEIVLVIAGAHGEEDTDTTAQTAARLAALLNAEGVSTKSAVRILTAVLGISRNEAYRIVQSTRSG